MQLALDKFGMIPATYPKTFYRVECWDRGRRVADFDNLAEAAAFAISDARAKGCKYDHKVATINRRR